MRIERDTNEREFIAVMKEMLAPAQWRINELVMAGSVSWEGKRLDPVRLLELYAEDMVSE